MHTAEPGVAEPFSLNNALARSPYTVQHRQRALAG
jgi:hypothetical protein